MLVVLMCSGQHRTTDKGGSGLCSSAAFRPAPLHHRTGPECEGVSGRGCEGGASLQLFDRMCMTLGGRAAEAITFKKITTGEGLEV